MAIPRSAPAFSAIFLPPQTSKNGFLSAFQRPQKDLLRVDLDPGKLHYKSALLFTPRPNPLENHGTTATFSFCFSVVALQTYRIFGCAVERNRKHDAVSLGGAPPRMHRGRFGAD
jgi:hypothetical protein